MHFRRFKDYFRRFDRDFSTFIRDIKRQLYESIPAIVIIIIIGVFIGTTSVSNIKSQLVENTALLTLRFGFIICFISLFFRFFIGQQIDYVKSALNQLLYLFLWVSMILFFGDFVVEEFNSNPSEILVLVIMILAVSHSAKQFRSYQDYHYATDASALSHRRPYTQKDIEIISVHESGHVLASIFLSPDAVSLEKVDISPEGQLKSCNLGTTFFSSDVNIHKNKKDIYAFMLTYLAGNVAEEILLEDMFTGSFSDNEQWERTAKTYLTCGFGDFYYSAPDSPLEVDANQKILGKLREEHLSILRKFFSVNKGVLADLSNEIKSRKIMTAEEIRPLLGRVVIT